MIANIIFDPSPDETIKKIHIDYFFSALILEVFPFFVKVGLQSIM